MTEVVTFSQPMDTSFTTSSSFSLYGNYNNIYYAAASFSWDPTGTILTINYDDLPNDTYTLTLYASGFENVVGIPLASNYVANFSVALGTASFTGQFTPVNPLGSLIYTATEDPVLVTPTDIDYLTVSPQRGRNADIDRYADHPEPAAGDHGARPERQRGRVRIGSRPRRGCRHRDRPGRHDGNLHDRRLRM